MCATLLVHAYQPVGACVLSSWCMCTNVLVHVYIVFTCWYCTLSAVSSIILSTSSTDSNWKRTKTIYTHVQSCFAMAHNANNTLLWQPLSGTAHILTHKQFTIYYQHHHNDRHHMTSSTRWLHTFYIIQGVHFCGLLSDSSLRVRIIVNLYGKFIIYSTYSAFLAPNVELTY